MSTAPVKEKITVNIPITLELTKAELDKFKDYCIRNELDWEKELADMLERKIVELSRQLRFDNLNSGKKSSQTR